MKIGKDITMKRYVKNRAKNSLQIDFSMYMNIPYCKGDKFKNIKVETLVVYATIETKLQSDKNLPKTPRQKPAKNPLGPKIFYRGKNLL